MNAHPRHRDIFSKRLKDASQLRGLSQKGLGIAAGIDEFVASAQINRYERGVHEVNISTACRLAEALNVPLAYFFAADENLAQMILRFSELSAAQQATLLETLESE